LPTLSGSFCFQNSGSTLATSLSIVAEDGSHDDHTREGTTRFRGGYSPRLFRRPNWRTAAYSKSMPQRDTHHFPSEYDPESFYCPMAES